MPLPNVGDLITGATPGGIQAALCNSPPVTSDNAKHTARNGCARWVGNKLEFLATGGTNYWYIPQAEAGNVNYCVVPCAGGGLEAYVVSDNYGGCEYHELYNQHFNILAFLHVHRENGTAQYQLARGWVLRQVKRSWAIAATVGSNWSISCIDRSQTPPVVASKFIRVGGYPQLTVQGEDSGDADYPPSAPHPPEVALARFMLLYNREQKRRQLDNK
jgi:hypothetical protein